MGVHGVGQSPAGQAAVNMQFVGTDRFALELGLDLVDALTWAILTV